MDPASPSPGLDGLVRPETWTGAILLRDYDGSRRRCLVSFLFTDGNDHPGVVLKLRHRTGPGMELEREWNALQRLRSALPPSLAVTVPAPPGYGVTPDVEFLFMSHLSGSSAYVQTWNDLRPGRWVPRHFRTAADWLASFHLATRVSGQGFVPGPVERALLELLPSRKGGEGPAWFDELVRQCRVRPVPLGCGHGDFWSRNILLSDPGVAGAPPGGAGVVDWEHFEPGVAPWVDLLHFPVSYGVNYPWSRYRRRLVPDAFRRTFLERNAVSRRVRHYLDHYVERTDFPRCLLRPLLHLYLLRRARDVEGAERRDWLECERHLARTPEAPGLHPSGRRIQLRSTRSAESTG